MEPVLALAVSAAAAFAGWRAGALTGTGAAAAALVGTAILGATGWPGAAALAAFFGPSSAVGRLGSRGSTGGSDSRGERRDPVQVLANGGPAAAAALLAAGDPLRGLWAVTCSLAAAAADTWATSLGVPARQEPRHLLTGRAVPRGTSGGVSLQGTLSALAGGALVAAAAAAAVGDAALFAAATGVGFSGMLLDSLLGAAVQARFRCAACGVASERRRHSCGRQTIRVGGLAWLDNDGVNAISSAAAAGAGWLLWP